MAKRPSRGQIIEGRNVSGATCSGGETSSHGWKRFGAKRRGGNVQLPRLYLFAVRCYVVDALQNFVMHCRILLNSDVVWRSYENVLRGLLFFRTQCTVGVLFGKSSKLLLTCIYFFVTWTNDVT